jgi:hypothetical protein
VPQIQQTVVRSGTCPIWQFANGAVTTAKTLIVTASAGYKINGTGSYTSPPTVFSFTLASNIWVATGGNPIIGCGNGIPDVATNTDATGIYYDVISYPGAADAGFTSDAGNSIQAVDYWLKYHDPTKNSFNQHFNYCIGRVLINGVYTYVNVGTFTFE